jgi:hypothetical protein
MPYELSWIQSNTQNGWFCVSPYPIAHLPASLKPTENDKYMQFRRGDLSYRLQSEEYFLKYMKWVLEHLCSKFSHCFLGRGNSSCNVTGLHMICCDGSNLVSIFLLIAVLLQLDGCHPDYSSLLLISLSGRLFSIITCLAPLLSSDLYSNIPFLGELP